MGNYRPISILQDPRKGLPHINQYLEKYDILNERQGGFRKYHSTVKIIEKLTAFIAAFIDFSKAFDTVDD